MDAKLFLEQSFGVEREAAALSEAIESLVCRGDDACAPLIEEYAEDFTFIQERHFEAVKMVYSLPDKEVRNVFIAKYIHKLTWEELEEALHISQRTAQRYYKKGLRWLDLNSDFQNLS